MKGLRHWYNLVAHLEPNDPIGMTYNEFHDLVLCCRVGTGGNWPSDLQLHDLRQRGPETTGYTLLGHRIVIVPDNQAFDRSPARWPKM